MDHSLLGDLLAKRGYYARLCQLQFSENPGALNTDREQVAQTSYEIRSLLSSLVGSLGLVVNGVVETPEEQQEYTQEAYGSALDLLKRLEGFERKSSCYVDLEAQLDQPEAKSAGQQLTEQSPKTAA
ncbi:MAG: hypothetical protein ACKO7W_09035 [Elainella sp.]